MKKTKKEDLYIRILLWAHDKQESGFSWEEMKKNFQLNSKQEQWIRKIFLTTSDQDRKFIELFYNDDIASPNVHYYTLNEKGIMAAVNYKGLDHAEKGSRTALYFAGISMLLTTIGLFFTIKQTNLTELQSRGERISQLQQIESAKKFCKNNPDEINSGLFQTSNGEPASCEDVLKIYK